MSPGVDEPGITNFFCPNCEPHVQEAVELRREVEYLDERISGLISKYQDETKRLHEALRFYADRRNYDATQNCWGGKVGVDMGRIAQAALE